MFHFLRNIKKPKSPIDLNNPDAVASVTNTSRAKVPFDKNYQGSCAIRENDFASLYFQTLNGDAMLCEQPQRCSVNFLTPHAYPYTLWIGRKIELYEGKYLVGTMVIEEIMNPILDRNAELENQNDILKNDRVLNLALKRSLEWGKTFGEPLDNKLMRSVPTLSGTDIETVSDYVTQVQHDIFYKIYYPNWDYKQSCLTVDAQKIVTEQYPWINKENLASLDSQGRYYAWHG